jgi:purine-binding chemotaxis protein CheW
MPASDSPGAALATTASAELRSAGVASDAPAPISLLVARVGDRRLALPAAAVERILRMAELTPLPEAPAEIAGVLNVHGAVLPVLDPRPRLGVPTPLADPAQHLLIVLTAADRYLVWVDEAEQIATVPRSALVPVGEQTAASGVWAVARLSSGLVPVFAPEALAPRALRPTISEPPS